MPYNGKRAVPWARLVPDLILAVFITTEVFSAAPACASQNSGDEVVVGQSHQSLVPTWEDVVRRLMNQGRLDDAETVLNRRLSVSPKDTQARFLKGMIAAARGNHQLAIRQFRSILIDEPNATRVRLELARSFYLARDYGNAVRQFQFALAGKPPPAVIANINGYMASIRDSKNLSYNFAIAIAPDSNLNTGSSAREVSLFGLPFDLSESARQRSGIGLSVEAGAEWAPRISKGKRWRIGFSGERRMYSSSEFNDMSLAAFTGPRLISGKWDISLLGTAYKRWYGSAPYSHAVGARFEATHYLTPRLTVSGALSVQKVAYSHAREREGPLISLNAGGFYALTPSSGLTIKGCISRQRAQIDAYSNWSAFAAAGFYKDLPMGFSAYVEPSYSLARYDDALIGFGSKRTDNSQSLLLALLNRHLVLTRFTPRLSYTLTRQKSSIPLYNFNRNRVEIGLTTVF